MLSIKLNKILSLKHRFKSSPIEIPETEIAQNKSTRLNANEDDDENFSFYDLLQSYYEDTPLDKAKKQRKTSKSSSENDSQFEEAPHFNLIANDLDVNNILNCSQKLLRSVSSTLKRVQKSSENTPNLICNDIIDKYSDSIESLDDENEVNQDLCFSTSELIQPYNSVARTNDTTKCDPKFEYIDINQLPRAIIKRWFREIIFVVKHLHANDILCYNLQPNNLLLGKNGEILLTYFHRREFNPYIFSDDMYNTCYPIVYIAPERPLTSQSDVWSMGVIFYELLTGYSFQLCHPDGISTYFDIQYPENLELDSHSRDLIEKVTISLFDELKN